MGHKESDMTERLSLSYVHFFFSFFFSNRLLQKRSLCYTVGSCWLSILYIIVRPSVLAWRIPGMGSHRVGHHWSDLAAAAAAVCICGEGNGNPLSPLAWKIPWTGEPGRLQSMASLRVGYDWVTSLSLFTFMHWRRKWQPTAVFLPGESQGWGSLVGCRLWGRA